MGRTKSLGPYTPLAANYYLDDAILEAREHAELLFVRCLSFLAAGETDGFITERQMLHAIGVGLRAVPKRVETLIEVDLLVRVDGGYVVRSYLKWNKSAEEIGRHLKMDRERKAQKLREEPVNSTRNPDGIQTDSSPHDTALHDTALHKELVVVPPTERVTEADFDRAYQHWPKKAERAAGIKAFRVAVKARGLEQVIDDVTRFGKAYAATTEAKYVPAVGRWLSHQRWTDQLPTVEAPTPPQQANQRPLLTVEDMRNRREEAMRHGA